MKILRNTIFILAFALVFISCKLESSAQNNKTQATDSDLQNNFSIPEGWNLFPKPKENSREIQCANKSVKNEWKVEIEDGHLKISKHSYQANEQLKKLPINLQNTISKNRNTGKGLGGYLHIESFDNGWLVGSDAGEWGGKLFWFSEDGTQKTELLQDNIRGIVKIDNATFILSGMAHMHIDEGKIYKLVKDEKGNFRTQLITDLKTQPQTFATESSQSILIALNDKILRLKSSGKIEQLNQTSLTSLYPNSMAITSSKVVYLGMRLFIVRLVPQENGYKEEWLVPQNCQKFIENDFDCVCQN